MSDSELLIGNKGLFSTKLWKDHQEKFEHNLGEYAYNHPAAKRAANKGLLKLKDIVLKASYAKTTDKEQQVIREVFFSNNKKSAGQVGRDISSKTIDEIIPRNTKAMLNNKSDGNLREKMTAFMNAAYFNNNKDESAFNLKQILKNDTGSFSKLGILSPETLNLVWKNKKFDSKALNEIDEEKLKQYKLSKQNSYNSLIQRQENLSSKVSDLNRKFLSYMHEEADRASIDTWKLRMREDLIKRQQKINSYKEQAEQNTRKHYILKFIAKIKNKSLLKQMELTEDDVNHDFSKDFDALNEVNYQRPDYNQDNPEYAQDGSNEEAVSSDYIADKDPSYVDGPKKAPSKNFDVYMLDDLIKFKRITKDEKGKYLSMLNKISAMDKLKPKLKFEADLDGDNLKKYYLYLKQTTSNNMEDVDMYKWDFMTKSSSFEGDEADNEIINEFISNVKNLEQQIGSIDEKIKQIDKQISDLDFEFSIKKSEREALATKLKDEKNALLGEKKSLLAKLKQEQKFTEGNSAQNLINISSNSRGTVDEVDSANFTRTADYYKSIGAELSERELKFLGLPQNKDIEGNLDENQTPINTDQALPWVSGRMSAKLDEDSPFYKILTNKKGMNLLTGISGTTARMLQSYKYLGFTNNEDLLNFRLALIGWMILGEDHSLYEILMGSHVVGVKGNEDLSDASMMDKSISPLSVDELRKNVCEQYNSKGLFPDEICYLEERFDDKYNNGIDIDKASSVEDKVTNINKSFASGFAELGDSFNAAEALSIRSYTSNDYKFINHILPLSPEQAESEIEERVKNNIRQILNRKPIDGNSLPAFIESKIRDYTPNFTDNPNIEGEVNNIYDLHKDINAKHILAVFSSEISIVTGALKKVPNKYTGNVYRGFGIKKGNEEKYSVGQIIPFKKLTSTSTRLSVAKGFRDTAKSKGKTGALYDITASGKYGVDVQALSQYSSESEILMPPGSKIKINEVTAEENGDLYIKAEEV